MAALGCVMLSPKELIPECIERFESSEVFYDYRNLTIYDVLLRLYDQNKPVDTISVMQELKRDDMLEQVGGLAYLASLPEATPSAANFSYYAEIVVEKHVLRRLVAACQESVTKIYDFTGTYDELLDEVSRDVLRVSESKVNVGMKIVRELVRESLDKIEMLSNRNGEITGIPTGFIDIDRLTSGWQKSDMIVIAARPSCGKTSLAMNMADAIAVEGKIPTGVFSVEMTAESLITRMICCRAQVNIRDVSGGFLSQRDFPRIVAAAGRIASSPLYIDDTSAITLQNLRAKARRMVEVFGVKIIFIDYLQLIRLGYRIHNKKDETTEISGGIKALAKELGVPVVVLSQLNRELEKDGARKPRLSDLRESGAIEQDADFVGLLYKPKLYDEAEPDYDSDTIPVNLLVAKQRNGPTGDIPLTFRKTLTRFENASKFTPEEEAQASQQTELVGLAIDEPKA